MNITVERVIDTENKEEFEFTILDLNIILTQYLLLNKPVGKRRWVVVKKFNHYFKRESNIPEPVLDDEIKKLAIEKVINKLAVKTFTEYKKK